FVSFLAVGVRGGRRRGRWRNRGLCSDSRRSSSRRRRACGRDRDCGCCGRSGCLRTASHQGGDPQQAQSKPGNATVIDHFRPPADATDAPSQVELEREVAAWSKTTRRSAKHSVRNCSVGTTTSFRVAPSSLLRAGVQAYARYWHRTILLVCIELGTLSKRVTPNFCARSRRQIGRASCR